MRTTMTGNSVRPATAVFVLLAFSVAACSAGVAGPVTPQLDQRCVVKGEHGFAAFFSPRLEEKVLEAVDGMSEEAAGSARMHVAECRRLNELQSRLEHLAQARPEGPNPAVKKIAGQLPLSSPVPARPEARTVGDLVSRDSFVSYSPGSGDEQSGLHCRVHEELVQGSRDDHRHPAQGRSANAQVPV